MENLPNSLAKFKELDAKINVTKEPNKNELDIIGTRLDGSNKILELWKKYLGNTYTTTKIIVKRILQTKITTTINKHLDRLQSLLTPTKHTSIYMTETSETSTPDIYDNKGIT